jgi:hypothetical protein
MAFRERKGTAGSAARITTARSEAVKEAPETVISAIADFPAWARRGQLRRLAAVASAGAVSAVVVASMVVAEVGDNVMKILPFLAIWTLSAQVKAPPPPQPKTFPTPDAAAQAIIEAAGKNNIIELKAIFGPESKAILTCGNPTQDAEERAEFARLARSKYSLEKDPMNLHRVMLDIGPGNWPFPVPIVEKDGKWSFEPAQGEIEVHARLIGADELQTIDLLASLVTAEQKYAEADRDNDGILEYAEFLMSSAPDKNDGLYSESSPFISKAVAAAEVRPGKTKAVPYHGYYFRVLTSQAAPNHGGTHNYVVQGKHMIGGFALVAWPAEYGVSGIATFIVNQDGVVYEKDCGPTPPVKIFAPDMTWTKVDEDR